jgi:4-hydroxybenzoate polyprenyltransferase
MHTDISLQGLISRLPPALRPYAVLARLDRPIGIWLLLLPGWWAIVLASGGFSGMTFHSWKVMVLFALGAVLMRAAGCVVNDLWDRDIDCKVERTKFRPLASGALGTRQALLFLFCLLLPSLFILLQFNFMTVVLGLISIPFILAYPYMKRITGWPQAFLGLTFNFGVLMGWAAIRGEIEIPAFLLYVSGFFWTLGYDTIYAHQDREDDLIAGIKSTALKFGDQSLLWVGVCYAFSFALLLAAVYSGGVDFSRSAPIFAAALHLIWQLRLWRVESPQSALRVFKSNRDYGLIVFVLLGLIASGA